MNRFTLKKRLLLASVATAMAVASNASFAACATDPIAAGYYVERPTGSIAYDATCDFQYQPSASDANTMNLWTRYSGGNEVILQGFHWFTAAQSKYNTTHSASSWYSTIHTAATTSGSDLRNLITAGLTAIWMPPPWQDNSTYYAPDKSFDAGGTGYLPTGFNKSSNYGTQSELTTASGDSVPATNFEPINICVSSILSSTYGVVYRLL